MNRLIFTFSALLMLVFSFSLSAHALPIGQKHIFWVGNETFKITEAYLEDGSSAYHKTGSFIKDVNIGAKGTDIYSKVESTSDYLYQYESNQQYDPNEWKVDSNPGLIMGRFSVYNYNNYVNGLLNNPFKQGKAEYNLDVRQYLNMGASAPKWNLTAEIDFYYWNNANSSKGSWFILTQTAFELGKVTDSKGVEYDLYLEVKQSNGTTWPGMEKLTGSLYQGALDYFGFASGTDIYGLYIPADGVAREIGFDIAGYAPGANPYVTPIPSAVWLMGTGIAGIIAVRRRNKK